MLYHSCSVLPTIEIGHDLTCPSPILLGFTSTRDWNYSDVRAGYTPRVYRSDNPDTMLSPSREILHLPTLHPKRTQTNHRWTLCDCQASSVPRQPHHLHGYHYFGIGEWVLVFGVRVVGSFVWVEGFWSGVGVVVCACCVYAPFEDADGR